MIEWSKGYLASKGFENARLEAELLLGHVLSLSRIELYIDFSRQLKREELTRYKSALRRRLAGEPVQYVTGTAAFMFSEYEVTPAVLIPRPETEALVEVAIDIVRRLADDRGRDLLVVDLGTGSGVIATSIALKIGEARVLATDTSGEALELAARNAERAGVRSRITFLEGSLMRPLEDAGLEGKVDAIISNPPYVLSGEIESLPHEVRDFEPRAALDGGPDGLDCIRAIAQDGTGFLTDGGALILEVGDGQAGVVRGLLAPALAGIEVFPDYAGRDRIVAGFKR